MTGLMQVQQLLTPQNHLLSDGYNKMHFTENYTTNWNPAGMCLSWFIGQLNGHTYFAHAGSGGGYYCEIRLYPDEGIGSVIFFNWTGMTDEGFLNKVDRFYFSNKSEKTNERSQQETSY